MSSHSTNILTKGKVTITTSPSQSQIFGTTTKPTSHSTSVTATKGFSTTLSSPAPKSSQTNKSSGSYCSGLGVYDKILDLNLNLGACSNLGPHSSTFAIGSTLTTSKASGHGNGDHTQGAGSSGNGLSPTASPPVSRSPDHQTGHDSSSTPQLPTPSPTNHHTNTNNHGSSPPTQLPPPSPTDSHTNSNNHDPSPTPQPPTSSPSNHHTNSNDHGSSPSPPNLSPTDHHTNSNDHGSSPTPQPPTPSPTDHHHTNSNDHGSSPTTQLPPPSPTNPHTNSHDHDSSPTPQLNTPRPTHTSTNNQGTGEHGQGTATGKSNTNDGTPTVTSSHTKNSISSGNNAASPFPLATTRISSSVTSVLSTSSTGKVSAPSLVFVSNLASDTHITSGYTLSTFTSSKTLTTTNSGGQTIAETTTLTSTTVVPISHPSSGPNRKAIIGGVIGVVLVLLAIGTCFFCRRRYRNRSRGFALYSNLDGDKPPRASIAHDTEAPPSPIFNPNAMVASSSSSRGTTPSKAPVVARKHIPFYDVLNDENVTIKRTATFSRLSRNSDPRSSISSQSTGPISSRYTSSTFSSSSSSFTATSDGYSIADTVKAGNLVDPFADPEPVLETSDPFADHLGISKVDASRNENPFRVLPPLPQLQPMTPSTNDRARLSSTTVTSSHYGVAM
ncbi:hypothetical protein F5880DRAFT_374478 [Lentinula raphanica]|nr:hypothetical protein F5880DRAFT_374478 [Lentinula raphanica]